MLERLPRKLPLLESTLIFLSIYMCKQFGPSRSKPLNAKILRINESIKSNQIKSIKIEKIPIFLLLFKTHLFFHRATSNFTTPEQQSSTHKIYGRDNTREAVVESKGRVAYRMNEGKRAHRVPSSHLRLSLSDYLSGSKNDELAL
jgi:hypothetical protein